VRRNWEIFISVYRVGEKYFLKKKKKEVASTISLHSTNNVMARLRNYTDRDHKGSGKGLSQYSTEMWSEYEYSLDIILTTCGVLINVLISL